MGHCNSRPNRIGLDDVILTAGVVNVAHHFVAQLPDLDCDPLRIHV